MNADNAEIILASIGRFDELMDLSMEMATALRDRNVADANALYRLEAAPSFEEIWRNTYALTSGTDRLMRR